VKRSQRPGSRSGEPPTSASAGVTRAASGLDASGIVASVGEAPYEWLIDTDVLKWGENAASVLNVADPGTIATGRGFARLLDPNTPLSRYDAIMQRGESDPGDGVLYHVEYCLKPDGQTPLWIEDSGRWFAGPNGKPARAHGVVRVINERHAQEQELTFLAQFDSLTGEINRRRLTEVLAATLAEAEKLRTSCGFLIAAIDHLARINDSYGYDVADEVIAAVAGRLRARMRGADVLGRLSGNKFGVILKNCSPDDMALAAQRLLAAVREEVVQSRHGPVAVSVTIGGVIAPRHAGTVDEILARAQDALNAARAKRHGSFMPYRPNIEREALRRENLRSGDEIISALNERRVAIAFEPVVETLSRRIAFHECLLRIHRTDGEIITAQNVVPVAEHLGFIRLLDHRVLDLVVHELSDQPDFIASLNASPLSVTDPDWWMALTTLLRLHPGVAQRLIVEITETTAIKDIDDIRGFVARAKDCGCRIAIDDFGAGYTSFRNLRQLGVDIVKIDGAFVEKMTVSEDDRAFVLTLVDLAKRLNLKTVAERVQDEATAAMLADCGCDYLQGKLIGLARLERPLTNAPLRAAG
jgi:diguanylate cyclase (GGDEF)-like protein